MIDISKLIFNSNMKSEIFKISENIKWLPILQCWEDGGYIGIAENGHWVAENKSGLYVLDDYKKFLFVMILLEQPISIVRIKVSGFLKSISIDEDVNDIFPFHEIVRAVFEEGRPYWIDLAFDWFDDLSLEYKKMLKASLSKIVSDKIVTQKLLHKAIREVRKLAD